MAKRSYISKKVRFDVFKRDGFVCQYCGGKPPEKTLHVDHINPVANGGDNHIDNLITSCSDCNLGKRATPLTQIPQSLKDKAKEIKEQEAQIKGLYKTIRAKKEREESEIFEVLGRLDLVHSDGCANKDHYRSVKIFISRLPFFDVLDAAEITENKRIRSFHGRFKYFCAICWKRIKESENGKIA